MKGEVCRVVVIGGESLCARHGGAFFSPINFLLSSWPAMILFEEILMQWRSATGDGSVSVKQRMPANITVLKVLQESSFLLSLLAPRRISQSSSSSPSLGTAWLVIHVNLRYSWRGAAPA